MIRMLFSTLLLVSLLPVSTFQKTHDSDVYALEVAGGGDACIGEAHDHSHDDHAHSDASSSAAAAASTTAAPTAQSSSAANIPAPPAESTGCVLHVDHYHCEGPATASASAAAAEATGDCHTHADGGECSIFDRGRIWS
jgi:hypothetical protein